MQLRRIALTQERTQTDLQFKQVLDNIAMFVRTPATLPYFAQLSSGTSQVSDALGPITGTWNWNPSSGSLGLNASRQLTESWSLAPTMDPDKLYLMRCAYQVIIGVTDANCNECFAKLQHFFGPNVNLAERLPTGWFSAGKKKDVPCKACFMGHYCDTFVWVLPDGVDGLTRFTLTILDIATASPPPVPKAVPETAVEPSMRRYRDIPRIPAVPMYVPTIPR